jgi:hypothetical protein
MEFGKEIIQHKSRNKSTKKSNQGRPKVKKIKMPETKKNSEMQMNKEVVPITNKLQKILLKNAEGKID